MHEFAAARKALRGAAVLWTNNQVGTPHTVTSAGGLWGSGELDRSGACAMAFHDLGDFAYACTIHPSMQGVVHVVSNSSQIPALSDSASSATPAAPPLAAVTAPPSPANTTPMAPTPTSTATSQSPPAPTPRPPSCYPYGY